MTNGTLSFRALGASEPVLARIKNPSARLGDVAGKVAARLGLAGTFQTLTPDNRLIDPLTPLEALEDDEVVLAPELTPACRG